MLSQEKDDTTPGEISLSIRLFCPQLLYIVLPPLLCKMSDPPQSAKASDRKHCGHDREVVRGTQRSQSQGTLDRSSALPKTGNAVAVETDGQVPALIRRKP